MKPISKKQIDEYVSDMPDGVLIEILNNRGDLERNENNRMIIHRMEDEVAHRKLEHKLKDGYYHEKI